MISIKRVFESVHILVLPYSTASYTITVVIMLTALCIESTDSEKVTGCFYLPKEINCRNFGKDGSCVDQKSGVQYKHERIPTDISVILTCPGKEDSIQITNVVYSLPVTDTSYCIETKHCANRKECSCCGHSEHLENECSYTGQSATLMTDFNHECQNITGKCVIRVKRVNLSHLTTNNEGCQIINKNFCRGALDCVSRWVTIDYKCQGKALSKLSIILICVVVGVFLLITIIIIIRKVTSDRALRRRDSYSPQYYEKQTHDVSMPEPTSQRIQPPSLGFCKEEFEQTYMKQKLGMNMNMNNNQSQMNRSPSAPAQEEDSDGNSTNSDADQVLRHDSSHKKWKH